MISKGLGQFEFPFFFFFFSPLFQAEDGRIIFRGNKYNPPVFRKMRVLGLPEEEEFPV